MTVTGPRNPDGWIFEFPGEEADPFVGTAILVNGGGVNAPDSNGSEAQLRSLTMELDGTEAGVYSGEAGDMSLSIVIPGEDSVNIGSDGELSGTITVSELSDTRFAGTIDIVLNDTGIDSEGDEYEVTGSFDVRE